MSFIHPLAKKARTWPMTSRDGSERRVLVIITTLTLDPESEHYKKKLVDRLTDAACEYLSENADITDFIFINRMKEWDS
jgi:hypothetical protein